jgi:DivIVA domain-containing protein
MTPEDVRSQRFTSRFLGGLSSEEVVAFLEDVAEAFDEVQKTNAALTARVTELEAQLQSRPAPEQPSADEQPASSHLEVLRAAALREVEALLRDAQAQAQTLLESANERDAATQRDAEAMRARVRIEAEEVVAGATATAEALVDAAREQEAAIRGEIDRLTQSQLELVDDVRKTLDTYHQWLTTIDPRGRARGRREVLEQAARGGNGAGTDGTAAR